MKKISLLICSLHLLNFPIANASGEHKNKLSCKLICRGTEKAANSISNGINKVLEEKKKNSGQYKAKLDYYKQYMIRKDGEINEASARITEPNPLTGLPRFTTMLIHNNIKKESTVGTCFSECGNKRKRAHQSIEFMYPYFLKVVGFLGLEDFKRVVRYNGTPFDTIATLKLLDEAARKIGDARLEQIFNKTKKADMIEFIRQVRANQASFTDLYVTR